MNSSFVSVPIYFPGNYPKLTALLDECLHFLRQDLVRQPFYSKVHALALAGGYGRGEGGVLVQKDGSAHLYNDVEFYLITGNTVCWKPLVLWCERMSKWAEEKLQAEVEFKLLRDFQLRRGKASIFYFDLICAHKLVAGSESYFNSLPAYLRDAAGLPLSEATRLLFNRGSGLFFAQQFLSEQKMDDETQGFIERNYAKLCLALGDAVLIVNGLYHTSCLERNKRLHSTPMGHVPALHNELKEWHDRAVRFKFYPQHKHPGRRVLRQEYDQWVKTWFELFLWVESIRLKGTFSSAEDYLSYNKRLLPEMSLFKNFFLRFRDLLKYRKTLPGWSDYPRASLQKALVALLELNLTVEQKQAMVSRFLSLKTSASAKQIEETYRFWWKKYS